MQLLVGRPCHLSMFFMVASYSSSGDDAESIVLIVSFVHARTPFRIKKKKKKLHWILELGHDNEEAVAPYP
jgi:hypothetical protein